jgi:hypothetical protein
MNRRTLPRLLALAGAGAAVLGSVLMSPAQAAPMAQPVAGLAYNCARIAVSSDGNANDRDDVGASAVALALLAKRGQQTRLVHWDYNNFLGVRDGNREGEMWASTEAVGATFGYQVGGVFWNDQGDLNGAINHLAAQINQTGPDNRLCIVGAGPMSVIYQALARTNPAVHGNVTLVTHSSWNDQTKEAFGRGWNFYDITGRFPGLQVQRIWDQNGGLGTQVGLGAWGWMNGDQDQRLRQVVGRIYASNVNGDVSDAGMMYFLITGDGGANPGKIQGFLG